MTEPDLVPRKTILVVDDDLLIRRVMRAALESTYLVFDAIEGQAALEVMARQPCDLVISDCDMPGMGGLELIGHIRANQPSLPIIVMSGELSEERRQVVASLGTTSLEKPFKPAVLLELVDHLLTH